MAAKVRILYVEDEVFLAKIVRETLESRGYEVVLVTDGEAGLRAAAETRPDVCLLDVMLPKKDGFTLGRELRSRYPDLPILFLTAKTEAQDAVQGLHLGAQDYIRKPFSMEELIARIQNALRHVPAEGGPAPDEIRFGDFTLNCKNQVLRHPAEEKKLSWREYELLRMLWEHRDVILDRRYILLQIWKDDSYFNSRNLDVYIARLRNFLKADPQIEIITVRGQGYRFVVP